MQELIATLKGRGAGPWLLVPLSVLDQPQYLMALVVLIRYNQAAFDLAVPCN